MGDIHKKDLIESIFKLILCNKEKCIKYLENWRKEKEIRNNLRHRIYKLYDEKKITIEQYYMYLQEIDNNFYKSINTRNFYKCQLQYCYDMLKIQLDNMANSIKYKIPNKKYTINDYIKIYKEMDKIEHRLRLQKKK